MPDKKPKITVYPCVIYELTSHNPEFHEGYRFRVHDFDDDKWYFKDKDRMFDQLAIHCLHPVREEKMAEYREKGKKSLKGTKAE